MLIITGTGRSGTETFARMFGGYHEFRVNYILDKYFAAADPAADLFDTMGKRIMVMLDLHQGIDPEKFIDSSNLYIHFIDAVHLLHPSVKFILSVRNGKDFVRSAFSRRWHERRSFGSVPQRDDHYFSLWGKMTPIQKNAWIWVYRNKKALRGLGSLPDAQKLVMKIEDVGTDENLAVLEAFAGLRITEGERKGRRYNANPSFSLPPKEAWTDAMNREFDEIAGEMMRFFEYE